jgi:signal transduction histidine kinase
VFRRLSLLWKIWLSASVALTLIFAITGLLLQRHAFETSSRSVDEAVKTGFQAYESVWNTRGRMLATVASVVSRMPDVRNAFGTGDQATIRDSTAEVFSTFSRELKQTAFFLVTTPQGQPIVSFDVENGPAMPDDWPIVRQVQPRFPEQVSGAIVAGGELFQTVVTPVYVHSGDGNALIDVLVAGYPVNSVLAQSLKESTGGCEFLFLSGGHVYASTLNDRATRAVASNLVGHDGASRASDGVREYAVLARNLPGPLGSNTGKLYILRSYDTAIEHLRAVRRDLVLMWLLAMGAGLGLSYWLVRRIVSPVEVLDRAAVEVAKQNYSFRVHVDTEDELGRLARTFNTMCASLQSAREELIRQERISTIGRLASSIVHDLRNPLAAIYGGSELLVDEDVPDAQKRRLAGNIHRAARRIQAMLQDLSNVSGGRSKDAESCLLDEVIQSAVEASRAMADSQGVKIEVNIPENMQVTVEKSRMERVFLNLIGNALEAMPRGGELHIRARPEGTVVLIDVEDTGPGISAEIRGQLFQPFVTYGKKNGLGLGLALSRQTVLDHGGDLWVDANGSVGARFCLRLPYAKRGAAVA